MTKREPRRRVSNRQVIAVDQDPAGIQGWQIPGSVSGNGEALEKPLSDGSYAVALLNRGSTAQVGRDDDGGGRDAGGGELQRRSTCGPARSSTHDRRAHARRCRRTRPCCCRSAAADSRSAATPLTISRLREDPAATRLT